MSKRLSDKDMTRVAILPVSDANGERLYRAIPSGKLCDRSY
ncbi:hypothetical protein [Coleofasciculus sp. H7-2]